MNLIESVIAAFNEHVGQESRDQTAWRDVVEDRHVVNVPQRREYLGSLCFVENRTIRSFQLAHRAVAVYRHEERVAERARLSEITHVSDVQKIEDAVSKNEPRACGTQTFPLSEHLPGAQNLLDH